MHCRSCSVVEEGQQPVAGYFAVDFDLPELQQLHAQQAMPHRDQSRNNLRIATFSSLLELQRSRRTAGERLGLYVEMKNAWYHTQRGFDIVQLLLDALLLSDLDAVDLQNLFAVQSFEYAALEDFSRRMRSKQLDVPLVWLLDCSSPLPTSDELGEFAKLATYVAVGCATLYFWSVELL